MSAGKSTTASRRDVLLLAAATACGLAAPDSIAQAAQIGSAAQLPPADQRPESFSSGEIVEYGHRFFGSLSRGLAEGVESAAGRWGKPNAYVLGQEAGGAIIGGLRFGEGAMHTRNAGKHRIYWQGPSLGLDAGADGDRTMMLVYNLPSVEAIFRRFGGVDGSAYLVGGFGFTALTADEMVVVPIRTGVGARLGVNLGYLKFTPQSTWNPF